MYKVEDHCVGTEMERGVGTEQRVHVGVLKHGCKKRISCKDKINNSYLVAYLS